MLEARVADFHSIEYWDSIGYTPDGDALVSRHANFVQAIAREYYHPNMGLCFEDLLQEGFAGLLEAASRFRPERGCKFVTYAAWWVRKPILKLITEQSQNIKIPAYRWSRLLTARALQEERLRMARSGRGDAGGGRDVMERIIPISRGEISLEETFDTEVSLKDHLSDARSPDPLHCTLAEETLDLLQEALESLDARERRILERHYGLDGQEPVTLQQIGDSLGLTRERVRQVEQDALRKLTRWMRRRRRGFPA